MDERENGNKIEFFNRFIANIIEGFLGNNPNNTQNIFDRKSIPSGTVLDTSVIPSQQISDTSLVIV